MKREGFAVWITGLPSAGKSTIARALVRALDARGIDVAVLESDELRRVLTPHSFYSDDERRHFYAGLAYIGGLLTAHGVNVVFDATGNRRAYRAIARARISHFIEVFVDAPLSVCMQRDVKGIYRMAQTGEALHVPGVQEPYEPPASPDVTLSGEGTSPDEAATQIVVELERHGFVPAGAPATA